MALLYETILVAATLLAWCGLSQATPPEGTTIGALLVAGAIVAVLWVINGRRTSDMNRRLLDGRWWGLDAAVRHFATPLALGGSLALAIWAIARAAVNARLGGAGSLLVLLIIAAVGAKLVAETYLFAQLGKEPSPRQESAGRLIGPWSGWAKLRYTLGTLGGIILPLGAQLLAGGAKNIPAVPDAGPPAILAVAALICLVPGEIIERWLFWRSSPKPAIEHLATK